MARVPAGAKGREKAAGTAHEGMRMSERIGVSGASGGETSCEGNCGKAADGIHQPLFSGSRDVGGPGGVPGFPVGGSRGTGVYRAFSGLVGRVRLRRGDLQPENPLDAAGTAVAEHSAAGGVGRGCQP